MFEFLSQSQAEAAPQITWPILLALAGIIVVIMVAGVMLWRSLFAEEPRFDSELPPRPAPLPPDDSSFSSAKTVPATTATARAAELLEPGSVASSADTVPEKSVDPPPELNPKFSSQPTVDSTGDASVSFDSDEEIELD